MRAWLAAALLAPALAGAVLLGRSSVSQAAPEGRDHWAHHNGHWCF